MTVPEKNPPATNSSLSAALYSSAVSFAQSALRAFLEKDFPTFLLHAGTALEHLAKAYLASLNESFVAASDFDSLLHASGLGTRSHRPPSRMKTISLRTALERAGKYFVPDLDNLSDELAVLVDVRNGVAHMGLVEKSLVERILVSFLRACEALLAEMGSTREEFWLEFTGMVDARLSASAEAAEIRTREAIAAARMEFERRYSTLPEHELLIRTIEDNYEVEPLEEDLITCPACGRRALTSGSYNVSWEADWDRDDFGEPWLVGASPTVKLFPSTLECRVCGLRLLNRNELDAADVPESWELEDIDPDVVLEAEREEWEKSERGYYDE
jgi:hypothetical protein